MPKNGSLSSLTEKKPNFGLRKIPQKIIEVINIFKTIIKYIKNVKKIMDTNSIFEVTIDGKLVHTFSDIVLAMHFMRQWFLETPFWDITQMTVKFYKNIDKNEDYINRREIIIEPSKEKNLMFKDDKRKYTCLRCRGESEICGFCKKCYNSVYGLENKEPTLMKLDDVVCNDKFIRVVENDEEYTKTIKESILRDGMKNPIIIDNDNRILIGHHRYYIAKELGWDEIMVLRNPIHFNHLYFYEGKGYSLFICRIDGNLEASTTNIEDVISIIRDFDAGSMGKTLIAEFFLNIGSDIRLRNVFIPERGHIVDQTWLEWWTNKFGKEPR